MRNRMYWFIVDDEFCRRHFTCSECGCGFGDKDCGRAALATEDSPCDPLNQYICPDCTNRIVSIAGVASFLLSLGCEDTDMHYGADEDICPPYPHEI